jgi:transposase
LRALLRTRKQLVREQASHIQRVQKTLEDANLKLSSVLSNIMGLSGRAVLKALIDGDTDPNHLLTLIDRRVKAPREKVHAALRSRMTDRHRFLLRLHLGQIDTLDTAVAEIDEEVDRDSPPPAILSHGPVSARAMIRVPANDAPTACAKARPG